MLETFKNLLLQNRGYLGAESLHKSSGTRGLPKLLNDGGTLTFDLFTARSSLLTYAFVWAPYISMGKMLRISSYFSSEAANVLKFHVEPPWGWGMKDCLNGCGLLTKKAAKPVYGKTLKNLLLQNHISLGLHLCTNHRGREVYQKLLK